MLLLRDNSLAETKWTDMQKKLLIALAFSLFLVPVLPGQELYHHLAQDTIITRPTFFGNVYLLDGKRLNLQVMQWFMTGHPQAYDQIKVAQVTSQLAVVSFTAGGLVFLSGYLIGREDPPLGNDLMLLGGSGLGAGLLLTLVSNGYQRRAVKFYNGDIRLYHSTGKGVGLIFGLSENGLTLKASFD